MAGFFFFFFYCRIFIIFVGRINYRTMYSFLLSVLALVLGYFVYGKFIARVFGPDPKRPTPAVEKADGVDFIVMPTWKVFMIQFLNIAGTGPIFGAIMGAKFGPAAYLWIVLGCIFAGAVHDYLTGMLSVRHGGASLPDLIGIYLGKSTQKVMLVFSVIMLMLVGAVFVYSPAIILGNIAGDGTQMSMMLWVGVIFVYYIIATLLPIDKIIGKIYPVFAFALLFMAAGLLVGLIVKWPSIPELWDGLANRGPELGITGQPIFPCITSRGERSIPRPWRRREILLACSCSRAISNLLLLRWRCGRGGLLHGCRRSRSGNKGFEKLAGSCGWHPGSAGRRRGSYHKRRYGFPQRPSDRGRFPFFPAEKYPQPADDLHPALYRRRSAALV